jgi:hypothetical protein
MRVSLLSKAGRQSGPAVRDSEGVGAARFDLLKPCETDHLTFNLMTKTLLAFLLAVCVTGGAAAADGIPAELAGEWVTDKTQFKDGLIAEGHAIYVNTNGMAALLAAPPPVGQKGTATYDARGHLLTIATAEQGRPGRTYEFFYDSKGKTLKSRAAKFSKEPFKRRSERIPKDVTEDRK